MIKIVKDGSELIVTKGAYTSVFLPQGWTKCEDEIDVLSDDNSLIDKDIDSGDKIDEASDFPANLDTENGELTSEVSEDAENDFDLNDLSVKELKTFAGEHGIDLDIAKNKQEMVALIRAEMEE